MSGVKDSELVVEIYFQSVSFLLSPQPFSGTTRQTIGARNYQAGMFGFLLCKLLRLGILCLRLKQLFMGTFNLHAVPILQALPK